MFKNDPDFAVALFNEALTLFLNGEPEAARLILRDLINATVGFEYIARITHKPNKSIQRMLSARGNPGMDSLSTIFDVLNQKLKISKIELHANN